MKTALFTVSFAGFWGQQALSLDECIRLTGELGYEGIEIMGKRPHLSPLDYSIDDCACLRENVERAGLKVAAIAGYTDFTGGLDAAEVPFADFQVSYVEQLARRAKILGCDLIRIFTSYERSDVPFARQWQITVKAIRECCQRAGDHGVSIGVQNHHDIGVDTAALEQLLLEVDAPNAIPMYDCWSPHLRGEDAAAGARRMGPRMRFTTVADYVTLNRWKYRPDLVNYTPVDPPFVRAVPMGEGELPYDAFFTALRNVGFNGWVSYEMCSPIRGGGDIENLCRYARRFLDYMKRFSSSSGQATSLGRLP